MNLGTLVASLTVETSGLKKGITGMENFQKKMLPAVNKIVRQLGTVSAAIKRVERNMTVLASGSQMTTFEKKMLANTNKMVRQLGRMTNQTRMLKKELLGLTTAANTASAATARVGAVTSTGTLVGGGGVTKTPSKLPDPKVLTKPWGTALSSLSLRLRSFGWLATTVFTAPLIMGGVAVAKMGREWEMAMAKIEGLVGIAKTQVQEWNVALLNMAKATARGPQELADTLYYVASSGFKSNEALRITEMSAKGAATGLGETKDVANFLTSAMNAYRASGLSAARAMDILTAAVREGKGEPAEMSRALGTILPIAAELGVSLDQVGGALASMTLITSQTSNAATYLRNVLMKLMHPSAGTEKALKAMGTSTEELGRSLKQQGLMATLMKLRELTDKYGESMAQIFPNIRALLGALNLTGQNMKYNEEVMKQVTESMGDFDKAFFIASGTVAFKWNAAVSGMKAGLIELGVTVARVILPMLEKWVERIQNLIKWFNGLNEGTQRLILRLLAFLAVAGPLSLILSTFGLVIGAVADKVTRLGGAMLVLNKIFKATAWGLAIAGVIALVNALRKLGSAQRELGKIEERINGLLAAEGFKLQLLFEKAEQAAEGSKARADAIKEINDRYGMYLSNLLKEKTSTEELKTAYDDAKKAMEGYIAVKEMNIELDKLQDKLGAKFSSSFNKYIDAVREAMGPSFAQDFKNQLTALLDEYNKFSKEHPSEMPFEIKVKGQELFDDFLAKAKLVPEVYDKFKKKMTFNAGWFWGSIAGYERYREEIELTSTDLKEMVGIYGGVYNKVEKAATAERHFYDNIKDEKIKEIIKSLDDQEKILNATEERYKATGEEYDSITEKTELYNDIIKKLSDTGLKDATEWIKYTKDKLKALGDQTVKSGTETETLTDIMNDFKDKMKALDFMNQFRVQFRNLGVEFDYVGEKTKLYEDTLKRLIEKHWGATASAKQMVGGLMNMEANTIEVVSALDKLAEGLSVIERRAQLEGKRFDIVSESIREYESALDAILRARAKMQNLDKTMITVSIPTAPFKEVIPLADYLNKIINDIYNSLLDLQKAQQNAIDRETINLLQAESDAFGGMVGKIDVLSYALEAAERNLKSILKQRMTENNIPIEQIQAAVRNINILKDAIASLNAALDLKYLQDMNIAIGNLSTGTELFNGYMSALENKLKVISANTEVTTEEFKKFAKELQTYKNVAFMMDTVSGAMEGLIRTIIEGGDETQTLGEKIKEYLIGVVKDLIAELLTAIAKTLLLKTVMASMKWGESDLGKELIKSLEQGITGVTSLDLGSIFNTDSINAVNDAMKALTESTNKYNEIVKTMISSETQVAGILKTGQSATEGAAKAGETLTTAKTAEALATDTLTASKSADIVVTKASTAANALAIPVKESDTAITALKTATQATDTTVKAADIPVTTALTAVEGASVPVKMASATASFTEAGAEAVKSASKLAFPLNLLAIAASVALVVGSIAALVAAAKMAKGGKVPPGYPNDSFPALLTSGETVVPKEKMDAMEKAGIPYKEYLDMPQLRVRPTKVPGLAGGGIIPPGYPNDTFAARLSSNEAVIPLDKLEKDFTVELEGDVRFVIEQDKLVGILSKYYKKNSIY